MQFKFTNANFPKTADGRVYHVGVKHGEVANRIITVGDPSRARTIAKLLDDNSPIVTIESDRGFFIKTGRYHGVPISIVSIGMGLAMMDFFVREVRAVVDGPLIIIRFGSCGSIGPATIGSMMVPHGAFAVLRNYDYFADDAEPNSKPYNFTKLFYADPDLCSKLQKELLRHLPQSELHTGLNASCDSFYSSQGRLDNNFCDANHNLIEQILVKYPDARSLEMETFMLFHMAKVSTPLPIKESQANKKSIRVAAMMMVFMDRKTNEFVDPVRVSYLEEIAGKALLNVLSNVELDYEENGSD
ncbi:8478_t:CDS:2 [Ambispora leptoticha]|uniref:8478_t:CDS:1 n=1 Tax=Ambispora leptoticha TaxID=144679 RepID=A0A9N9G4T0_9GLOM|nr:8478_t:CDS:2 [Ambispora leptoticha]